MSSGGLLLHHLLLQSNSMNETNTCRPICQQWNFIFYPQRVQLLLLLLLFPHMTLSRRHEMTGGERWDKKGCGVVQQLPRLTDRQTQWRETDGWYPYRERDASLDGPELRSIHH